MRKLLLGFAMLVICCCRVSGGGSCCAEVSFCSGNYVPGCFCSAYHTDFPEQSYACRLNVVQGA